MNCELILNIFISVFSGILTSLLIFAFVKIFNKIIIPWYQSIIYKGLDISGEWNEEHNYENLFKQESKIIISQNANSIKGKIILVKKTEEKIIDLKNFSFTGEFYNNYLNITCWNENKRQIGTHNYLMQIERDGKEMDGFKTYFDIGHRKIRSEEVSWNRK
ncbi:MULTISPECIES: hypothetical protein [unclassified Flavobacterium]|jgi:hypothetical protein|uniref:hypothetical protein n=1 Tax=unclassified Flavobacterium TaxID=196869 RepID=UPI0025C14675|nr:MULTISPECIES: hypothetical protein [unclassified Flavobacterium]